MGVNIIPVLAAMYLGNSFDLKTYHKGNADIYDLATLQDNIRVIDRSFTKSQYKLVESSLEARKFLDVDGALSLRIKKGDVDIGGTGAYLRETTNRQNFVELLVRVQHETVTETIPSHLKPKTDWMSMNSRYVGTHFVRSITYGGELIASLRLKASNRQEREIIKAAVTSNLQLSGTFDLNANGSFDKLRKELKGMYNEEIKVTATKKPSSPPQTVEELMKIVENYPSEINSINKGKGKALKAELYPLSSLKSDYPQYLPNSALNNMLDDIESKYDDIRITIEDVKVWNKDRKESTEEEDEKVEEFFDGLQRAQNAFHIAIGELDVSSAGKPEQFQKAFDAYGTGKDNLPNRFQRQFLLLKHQITGDQLVWKKAKASGVTYINWGSKSCESKASTPTTQLYWGYAAGGDLYAWNSGKNTQCLPENDPRLSSPLRPSASTGTIQTVEYRDIKDPESSKFLRCSVCIAAAKIVQEMFVGVTKCPDDWSLEYSGYLMADSSSNVDRDFFCVNKKKDDYTTDEETTNLTPKINHVFMNCEKCNGEKIVPCVVCTK